MDLCFGTKYNTNLKRWVWHTIIFLAKSQLVVWTQKNCDALPPSTSHENLGEKREQVECRSSWKYGTVGTSQLTHIQKRWLLQPGHWNQECNKMVRFTTGVVKMLSGRVLSRFFGSCLVCRINLIFSTPLTGAVCVKQKNPRLFKTYKYRNFSLWGAKNL